MSNLLTAQELHHAMTVAIECADAAYTMREGAASLASELAPDRDSAKFIRGMRVLESRLSKSLARWRDVDDAKVQNDVGIAMAPRGGVHKVGSVAASTAHTLARAIGRSYLRRYLLKFAVHVDCVPKPTAAQTRQLCKKLIEWFRGQPEWSYDELVAEIQIEHANAVAWTVKRPKDKPDVPVTPHYDRERRELRVGSELVKRFRQRAKNQELVLVAFEGDHWPPRIDDPLPVANGRTPYLRETIRALNGHQQEVQVKFAADGTREGVTWTIGPRRK